MKKLSTLMLLIFTSVFVNAQKKGTDWLKLGVHAGIPVADTKDASSFAVGVDAKYQFLDLKSFGLGLATGYTHYFKKNDAENIGLLPVAALLRYYPTRRFFLGADVGVGVAFLKEDTKAGFYYRPELGYHNDEWNVFVFYQGDAVKDLNIGAAGIGVSYNILRPMK
ncbi:hypothetical protein EDL99_00440 [Ornithobacterium rhinotracheale]|uniref:outer membrane beta-barrel protein n=1 Tax=Ornithobacterium rhinotracheale TaxID=28251 RepID=UPI00129C2D35|nr:outer membrane beta-barrel protein [Ornithobacterium rhinotracheale]MRJ07353.1 hypothetical protein [Ornithobacterium rhinotracheale]UOH77954.1 hypothetical protein MT996_00440 [Ornithobacterium rhinotracheale]